MRDITGSSISVTQASAANEAHGIHARLTDYSSRIKTSGAKSLQSFHQGKIRTCLFSRSGHCNARNRALLRAHFLVHNSSDGEKMTLQAGKMRRSAPSLRRSASRGSNLPVDKWPRADRPRCARRATPALGSYLLVFLASLHCDTREQA